MDAKTALDALIRSYERMEEVRADRIANGLYFSIKTDSDERALRYQKLTRQAGRFYAYVLKALFCERYTDAAEEIRKALQRRRNTME